MKLAITVLLAPLALAGCGSDSDVAQPSPTTSSLSRPAAPITTVPTVAPDVPGKIVVREETSACSNESPASPIGLVSTNTQVGVAGYAGNAVRVTWTYSGQLPATGTVLFSLIAANESGSVVKQLGYKTLDGEQIAYFVAGMPGKQVNLSGFPDTGTPGEVSAVMPSDAVDSLGDNWHWSSAINIDGKDVDVCPN